MFIEHFTSQLNDTTTEVRENERQDQDADVTITMKF